MALADGFPQTMRRNADPRLKFASSTSVYHHRTLEYVQENVQVSGEHAAEMSQEGNIREQGHIEELEPRDKRGRCRKSKPRLHEEKRDDMEGGFTW